MASIRANDITIEYESHGSPEDPAILMVMGLSAQLTFWPPALIKALVDAGFRVVTFDNRDVGLSEKMHEQKAPNIIRQAALARIGIGTRVPYTIEDMVEDASGLLSALGIDRAHIVGVSMGGMIGQLFAAGKPAQTISLVSIMSSTNNPTLPKPNRKVADPVFLKRSKATTKAEMVDDALALWSLIGTKDSGADPSYLRERIEAGIDRNHNPAGVRRQVSAIIASGDLRQKIRRIKAPTLIIHGSDDPLVPVEGGMDSARSIPGAELKIIEGMAHDIPQKFLPEITRLIVDHVTGAQKTRPVL